MNEEIILMTGLTGPSLFDPRGLKRGLKSGPMRERSSNDWNGEGGVGEASVNDLLKNMQYCM